jgi:hypothetical protein
LYNFETDPRFGNLVEQTSAAPWLDLPVSDTLDPYVTCENTDGAMVLVDSSPAHLMNRVFCLGLEKPATAQTIDRILKIYEDSGADNFLIHLSPMARPTSLPRLLEERGIKQAGREAVAIRDTSRVRRPDPFFGIRRAGVDDRPAVVDILEGIGGLPKAFVEFICQSIGRPNWLHFLALDGTKAYSLSGTYIKDGRAWMAPGWTLPAYRNRGAHGALIAQSINSSADAGCEWITTSYPASIQDRTRSYERAGFKLLYMRGLFRPEASPVVPMGVSARVSQPK